METIKRVALYIRVSTEEQALHGDSLAAQEAALVKFAAENSYRVVGIYRDAGHSARVPASKREVMQALLQSVRNDELDMILFIKLDRWFRNVSEYHNVQSVLDQHRVEWRAILENYTTETADGRLKINIMLSVAENEADRTSERLKFVFQHKQSLGEVVNGRVPYGYCINTENGKSFPVIDEETRETVETFWRCLLKGASVLEAAAEADPNYQRGSAAMWYKRRKNPIYKGDYNGTQCPAYVTPEEWEIVQPPPCSRRRKGIYIFSGLVFCKSCSRRMVANYSEAKGLRYKFYRCPHCYCTKSERKIEHHLLSQIKPLCEGYVMEVKEKAKVTSHKQESERVIKEKLRRLNNVYIAGNLSDDEYASRASDLNNRLTAIKTKKGKKTNLDSVSQLLAFDLDAVYGSLSDGEKQLLWRSVLSGIIIDNGDITEIRLVEG